jgi:hypothetical protein
MLYSRFDFQKYGDMAEIRASRYIQPAYCIDGSPDGQGFTFQRVSLAVAVCQPSRTYVRDGR